MAIPTDFASPDDAPDFLKEHLKKRDDGRWAVQMRTVDGQEIGNVAGALSSLETIKTEKSTLADQLRDVSSRLERYKDGDDYVDPEAAINALKGKTSGQLKDAEELAAAQEAIEQRLRESFEDKIKTRDATINSQGETLKELMITSNALSALSGKCPEPGLLLPHIASACQLRDDGNGGIKVVVMKEGSDAPRVSMRDGQEGQEMTVEEYCQDILPKKFPLAFPSRGEGAGPSGRSAGSLGKQNLRSQKGIKGTNLLKEARSRQLREGS